MQIITASKAARSDSHEQLPACVALHLTCGSKASGNSANMDKLKVQDDATCTYKDGFEVERVEPEQSTVHSEKSNGQ